MAEQGLARRRLPDHVVLNQAEARQSGEPRTERGDPLGQNGRADGRVRLPDVAKLASAVGRRGLGVVVDLVGRDAGLPLVRETAAEALAQARDLIRIEPRVEDQKAVPPVRVDLPPGRLHATVIILAR